MAKLKHDPSLNRVGIHILGGIATMVVTAEKFAGVHFDGLPRFVPCTTIVRNIQHDPR